MPNRNDSTLVRLIEGTWGPQAGRAALDAFVIDRQLLGERDQCVSRGALRYGSCDPAVRRLADTRAGWVPHMRGAAPQRVAASFSIMARFAPFSSQTARPAHCPLANWPSRASLSRWVTGLHRNILFPRLRMTGHAYAHIDLPETIPQYFVSELHIDRFDEPFAEAAQRVFGTSCDPLSSDDTALLDQFRRAGWAPFPQALAGLPRIAAAFGRQHGIFDIADYETLRAQSAEAAWIATEGNGFNHATDRVEHVEALADALRAEGLCYQGPRRGGAGWPGSPDRLAC